MKNTLIDKITLLAIVCLGLGLAPTLRAAHATTYLDDLQAAVTERLQSLDSSATRAERQALRRASAALNRNTSTLNADLVVLAQASTALNTAYAEDETFVGLQQTALGNYAADAQALLDVLWSNVGDMSLPRGLSNQLAQAQAAIDRGNDSELSMPTRTRSISFALNKIRAAAISLQRTIRAPASLEGQVVTLTSAGRPGSRVTITLFSDGSYSIPGAGEEGGDEFGIWSYQRTSPNTGTVTLTSSALTTGELNLRFTGASRGTFSGTGTGGQNLRGQFNATAAPPPEEG